MAADLLVPPDEHFKIPHIKDISETQFMLLLDQNPALVKDLESYIKEVPRSVSVETEDLAISKAREKWIERFKEAFTPELREKFRAQNNPLVSYEITDKVGYSDPKVYITHPKLIEGKLFPADNLKEVWIKEIRKAKKEIKINIFDFDLEDVADELIAAKKRGVKVEIGIDKGVIEARPEVKHIYDKLTSAGVFVHPVDSVGLNHPKLFARDWSLKGQGFVIMSEGNLTQSCIGPEGDLKAIP